MDARFIFVSHENQDYALNVDAISHVSFHTAPAQDGDRLHAEVSMVAPVKHPTLSFWGDAAKEIKISLQQLIFDTTQKG